MKIAAQISRSSLHPRYSKLHAYTFVELIVIVGIIALLAVLLIPALQGMFDRGRQAICMSNLRGYGNTMLRYAAEYNGLPRFSPNAPDFSTNYTNYTGQPLPRCPLKGAENKGFYYTCNSLLSEYYPTLVGIPVPYSRVVFAAERNYPSGFSSSSHFNMTIWANNDGVAGNEGTASPANYSQKPQYHGSRDRRGLNFMFLDGHCETITPVSNNWTLPPIYGPTKTSQAGTNHGYFYHSHQFENMYDGSLEVH